jgi:hypothetical protein
LAWFARRLGGSSGSVCGTPFFPRVLIHLVGLGLIVRQRCAVGGGQRAGLDRMPQPKQMLAADPHLAGELCGGHPLRDTAEDQEDLCGAQMGALPEGIGEHVEDPAASLAAVIDDRGVLLTSVNVKAVVGTTPGANEPLGVEQIEELLAAPLLVHQVDNREVHEVGSEETKIRKPDGQKNRFAPG